MGTQQILMIVLSVIVVGAAVSVGIMMFDAQSRNQARAAIYSDFLKFGTDIQAYFRTPVLMGGAGNSLANIDAGLLYFLTGGADINPYPTPNGEYYFSMVSLATPYIDIEINSIPAASDWVAIARVFFDGRTIPAQGIDKGIWAYVGPGPLPSLPTGE